ncbi:MAG: transcriptional regulator [Firmicutes bacterium HGW-Firmicutes-12]|jgi:TrpR family trp operon transcriptional repressor|nr:MAG: transcriptional regulator [Firmicutes bacterium HGW-Firmicutes-12]
MSNHDELIEVFTKIDDYENMQKLFKEIFTPHEIDDIALRWQLMKMLHQEIPQRKIAADLGISLCKITRGAKVLKEDSITKKILNRKMEE